MKTAVLLVVGSLVSFLTLLMIALALVAAKPEWFGNVPKTPLQSATLAAQPPVPDTSARGIKLDSTQTTILVARSDSSHTGVDTILVTKLATKARTLESQVDSLKRQLQSTKSRPDSVAQQDWKATAKLIESMSPEDASKILKQMDDNEVKQVLAKVKTRQAGKILAILDPARAAKIMR